MEGQQTDHDLLVRIDERSNSLHAAVLALQQTLDKKVGVDAFLTHTKNFDDHLRELGIAVDRTTERQNKTESRVSWLYGIVAFGGVAITVILHFWKG